MDKLLTLNSLNFPFSHRLDDEIVRFCLKKPVNAAQGNHLLEKARLYLNDNPEIDDEEKQKIRRLQFWLLGFMYGKGLKIDQPPLSL